MSFRRNSWLIRYKGSPLTYLAFKMLAAREGVRMLFRSNSFGRSAFTIVWLSFPAYTATWCSSTV